MKNSEPILLFMRRAIQISVDNVCPGTGGPFGAVVVKDGRLIAEGANLVTSGNDPTAHAEIVAIRNACKVLNVFQLTGCDLYASCEPCPMCLGAIYWARPDRVFYGATYADAARSGFDDAFIYVQLKLPPPQRAIPMQQILADEAQAGFEAWMKSGIKVQY